MADVFISYAREDRDRAEQLAALIARHGRTVWWDRNICLGRDFDLVIERELDAALAVVVLWSSNSVGSTWVRAEARSADDRSVLVPAILDDCKVPLAFRSKQCADLRGWPGDESHQEIIRLLSAVNAVEDPRKDEVVTPQDAEFSRSVARQDSTLVGEPAAQRTERRGDVIELRAKVAELSDALSSARKSETEADFYWVWVLCFLLAAVIAVGAIFAYTRMA